MTENLNSIKGLTEKEAQEIIKKNGYNELPSQKRRGFFNIFWGVLKEPMLLILVAAGLVYFFLGETRDGLMLSVFVIFTVGITFYQQRKTERALEALRNLSSPRALVIREGLQRRISGREVVVEDILVLREGDRIAADAMLLDSTNLMVDESLLTGESLAVSKSVWDGKQDPSQRRPGGDDLPFVYSGTLVTRGHGLARVFATGISSEMGKIGKSLQGIKEGETILSKEMLRLARLFGTVGLSFFILVVVFYLSKGKILEGILYGLTIGMSMLPEEFPVVMLIFLALGAWRISKHKVLTRNASAIESLGAANVLCVDKTGTLTLNQMRLQELSSCGKNLDLTDHEKSGSKVLPDNFKELLEYAMLASQSDPFDPLEKEIKRSGDFFLFSFNRLRESWKLIKEYPFCGNLLALSHVWETGEKDRYIVAAKGAPESIADLCHFSDKQKLDLENRMEPMLERGMRLIAVAAAKTSKTKISSKHQHDFDFKFVGLLGFSDPVRPSVPSAIKECYKAGIRVCMITGDYPKTAQYIARAIGLENPGEYLTGDDLAAFGKQELQEKIKKINIFARVVPEQKMLIVDAFKKNGEVIVMTGDGVNDAPALKSANVGIAMAERGTDVAREAADLVLMDDNFSSIVAGIKMGRTVFDNIKKAIAYIFSVHIPIAGMSFFPIAIGLPVVFYPAHIAFLELVIDPACSIVFENEQGEKNIMNRPPRKLKEPLFGKKPLIRSLLQGCGVLVAAFLVFLYGIMAGNPEGEVRALSFASIVFANLALIAVNLSAVNPLKSFTNGNRAFLWIFIGALSMLALVLCLPSLRSVFHFDPVGCKDLLIAFGAAIIGAFWFEPFRLVARKIGLQKNA